MPFRRTAVATRCSAVLAMAVAAGCASTPSAPPDNQRTHAAMAATGGSAAPDAVWEGDARRLAEWLLV